MSVTVRPGSESCSGRVVIFNGAGAGAGQTNLVALMENGRTVAERHLAGRGASEQFAPVLRTLLNDAKWHAAPDLVAAVVGPGSFTGLRASLSLAAGLAAGWHCALRGVTAGAAIRATLGRSDVVCVSLARRGRVFVDAPDHPITAWRTQDLDASGWSIVAGDAVAGDAPADDVFLTGFSGQILPCVAPTAIGILMAAQNALPEEEGGLPFQPLYVDPPEAKPPASGLRPAPHDHA